jgi:hypothetical protein
MSAYLVRPATIDDVDALVHHRLSMFSEMGTAFDAPVVGRCPRLAAEAPAARRLPRGCGHGVRRGGRRSRITLIMCRPPSAFEASGSRLSTTFIPSRHYQPRPRAHGHRARVGARTTASALSRWNAAPAARHLYETQYREAPSPMMWRTSENPVSFDRIMRWRRDG